MHFQRLYSLNSLCVHTSQILVTTTVPRRDSDLNLQYNIYIYTVIFLSIRQLYNLYLFTSLSCLSLVLAFAKQFSYLLYVYIYINYTTDR